MSQVSIKLQNAADIRRVTVNENISLVELRQLVQNTFGNILLDGLVFKYKDNENEFITLTNDMELSDAIHRSKLDNHSLKILVVAPWLPAYLVQSIPFQLNPARFRGCSDRIRDRIRSSCEVASHHIRGCADRAGSAKPLVKKGLLCLAFLWWLCHGCSLFILGIAGFVGFKYFGLCSSIFNDNHEQRRFHGRNQYVPSAPPVEQVERDLYPSINAPIQQHNDNQLQGFQEKMKQLSDMGFYDSTRNINALLKNNGNVVEAVKTLLDG